MGDLFENAEQEFLRLKGQLAAGRITSAQFDAALKELIVEDAQSKFWMLGADSGKWYVHDGQSWVEATPPAILARDQAVPVSKGTPLSPASSLSSAQSPAHTSRQLKTIIGTVGGGLLTLLVGLAVAWGQGYLRNTFLGGPAQPAVAATATLSIAFGSTLTPTPTITPTLSPSVGLSPAVTQTISQVVTATISPTASPTVIPTTTPIPVALCPGPPVIAFFTASPQTITAGQSTTLSWGAVTNATSAAIDQGIGGVPAPGSRAVVLNGTTTFTISATGCGGTTTSQVRVTVNPAPTATNTPLPPTPVFVWDFTPCNNQSTTSSGNFELFDPGQVYGGSWVGNGCAVRFKTGGSTSMQATFTLNLNPQIWSPRNATILIYHLSSLPGGGQSGYSPVQVTLNGTTVYQGSPGPTNTGPGNLWASNSAIVTSMLRQGSNTLRWDYLNGATTHYWLKSFRISW